MSLSYKYFTEHFVACVGTLCLVCVGFNSTVCHITANIAKSVAVA